MKKIYIFLLGLLALPMCVVAQDSQNHLFPAITFHVVGETVEYTVPAWDAKAANGERVQRTEMTNPDEGGDEPGPSGPGSPGPNIGDEDAEGVEYNGIIVASACGILAEDTGTKNNARGPYDLDDPNNKWPKYSNIVIDDVEYDPVNVTYGDILGDEIDPELGGEKLFSTDHITGDNYVIPSTAEPFEQDTYASKYNIVGLGDNAYWDWTYNTTDKYVDNIFQAKSLTIPATIKFLGRRSFQAACLLTKVEIAEDSEIEELPYGCFAHCQRLKEINIPLSITNIGEHALGGGKVLGKIVFAADESPTVHENAFVKIGSSIAVEIQKKNCAIWVNSIETVKAFRNANSSIWNAFAFCIPFNFNKQLISYCSEYVISQGPLVFGTIDNVASWPTPTDDKTLGGDEVKLYYVNGQKGTYYFDPQYEDGQYTIKILRMTGSPANPGFGILMSADPGVHNLYIRAVGTAGNGTKNNILVGTLEPTDMTNIINDANNDIYVLKNGQFVRCTGGTLPANKSYLKLPKNVFDGIRTEAKEINIEFGQDGDDTDGILQVENGKLTIDNDAVYDLQGRKVENPSKGIYIMNGKKYILK